MRQAVIRGQLEEISNANDLDKSLRDLLIQLNKAGYCTVGSCSGYRWEHTGRRKSRRFGPFVSIMVRNWEAMELATRFRQILFGTYWTVGFRTFLCMSVKGNKQRITGYSYNMFYDEKYDLPHYVVFLSYKKSLSDEQIKRGWDILLSKLVGD